MHFSLTFLSAVALLGMNQAVGAALEPRAALIATDSYHACNKPNNGGHHAGSSCKYYESDGTTEVSGHCEQADGSFGSGLYCL